MAWEWSHTDEAYDNAKENLAEQTREWLQECSAEISATSVDDNGFYTSDLDLEKYEAVLREEQQSPIDCLIEAIWDFMQRHRTCDNGGFNAYCCPTGCHTVPFDPIHVDNEGETT